jgi:DNA polymerase/3'-5' exonuclease PolX
MNNLIINQFKLLIKQIKFDIDYTTGNEQIKNSFRLQSIQKVLSIIEKIKFKITSSSQLEGIKGIGTNSLSRIDEILKDGQLKEIKISEEGYKYLNILAELEDVFGIGRKKAYDLFTKYSVKSIDDLKKKVNDGLIKLPESTMKGLEYVGKINTEIPKEEINVIHDILKDITFKISSKLFCIICGSYRREKKICGDIDILLFHTDLVTKNNIDKSKKNYLNIFVKMLKNKKIIIESLTDDNVKTKYMGIGKLSNNNYYRIDIRLIQYQSFYPAILYFTGSREMNRKMRYVADSKGWLLNEYGLFDENNNMISVNSEKDIFELLQMEYVKPTDR